MVLEVRGHAESPHFSVYTLNYNVQKLKKKKKGKIPTASQWSQTLLSSFSTSRFSALHRTGTDSMLSVTAWP